MGAKGASPGRGDTYDLDVLAGAQAVVEAHPVVVVGVLPVGQHVHVPSIVGSLVGHPGAPIHTDGVAAAQVSVEIGAVAVTLVVTAQEVLVFIEGDLERAEGREWGGSSSRTCLHIPATFPSRKCLEAWSYQKSSSPSTERDQLQSIHQSGPNASSWHQCSALPRPLFCPSPTQHSLGDVPVLFPAEHSQNNSLPPSLDEELLNYGRGAVRSQWNVQSRFLETWVGLAALG